MFKIKSNLLIRDEHRIAQGLHGGCQDDHVVFLRHRANPCLNIFLQEDTRIFKLLMQFFLQKLLFFVRRMLG